MPTAEGNLRWRPLAEHTDLVAPPVARAAHLTPDARVAQVDPELSDTPSFCATYDVPPECGANCVIVLGRRGDTTTHAAVLVLATDRADINKAVRKHLGARKVSFADQEETERLTGMLRGGITPIGLPADWEVLVDEGVAAAGPVVIGGGVRSSKILVDGAALAALPNARVLALTAPRAS